MDPDAHVYRVGVDEGIFVGVEESALKETVDALRMFEVGLNESSKSVGRLLERIACRSSSSESCVDSAMIIKGDFTASCMDMEQHKSGISQDEGGRQRDGIPSW